MLKYFLLLGVYLLFVSKTYLFYAKKFYNQLIHEAKEVQKDLSLLKVEWMYLNQPERVQKLVKKLDEKPDQYKL